jgi:predicted DNA-binding transcriptional regulator AlpA
MTDRLNEKGEAAQESEFSIEPERPLREDEAARGLGFSRTRQFRKAWMRGRAPRPVKIDGMLRWRVSDIYTWLVQDANR